MDFRIFMAIGLSVSLTGCGSEQLMGCAGLQAITATVVNPVGQPLDALQVTDTIRRTGAVLPVSSSGGLPAEASSVLIFSDDFKESIRRGGDEVVVVVSAGGHSAAGLYRFGSDGCHVQKLSGPDSLTVS
jgi:hypothetical protein